MCARVTYMLYAMHACITYILSNMYALLHIYYIIYMHHYTYTICYVCMYYIYSLFTSKVT